MSLSTLRQLVEQSTDNIDRWLDLCEAAERERDYAEVLRAGERVVRLAPDRPAAHFICGLALHRLDRIEEAIEAYRRVLALHSGYVDAWVNLGECCRFLNRIEEAEHAARQAVVSSGQAIADEDTRVVNENEYGNHHWNLALIELLKGDLRHGFAHYRARPKAIAAKQRPDFPQPLWRGEDLRGKTILITVDQGHGDTLMMARFLPVLRARGARVYLQAQPALAPLLKDWPGADMVFAWGQGALPEFDFHASEFDLPHYLGTTLETIPSAPYLPLPPPDDATRLPDDGMPRVGIIWSGNPDHRNDKKRSIPLREFAPLFALEHIRFFSLNRDMREGDAEILARLPVIDLAPRLVDFAASARIVGQLDVVITCDTSSAHLAGGMGKPVWVLLPFAPSWHWMSEREDSPWYPSMRLFRQKSRGDWGGVIDRVRGKLKKQMSDR